MYLGIDVGGTHTDAVLCSAGAVHGMVKVKTHAQHVAQSIRHAVQALHDHVAVQGATFSLQDIQRITVSTTLGLNAMVQGKALPVGVLYTAGPGMDPQRFLSQSGMGRFAHRVPGGLDHRGCQVTALCLDGVQEVVQAWQKQGVQHFAVAGKFSVRNAQHEKAIAAALEQWGIAPENISLSHTLSGQLNFPRRMAAAYINASIQEVQRDFLRAVQSTAQEFSLQAPLYFLKADGGALPWEEAMETPLHTVLSGPAASVMGAMVLGQGSLEKAQDALLMDMGGSTTDIALYAHGLPVLDGQGMLVRMPCAQGEGAEAACVAVEELRTPVRSLATLSLALGGDSPLSVCDSTVTLSSVRQGAAMALGGSVPTLVDALVVLAPQTAMPSMNVQAAYQGIEVLCQDKEIKVHEAATQAVHAACMRMVQGIEALLHRMEGAPVYTLAKLLEGYTLHPKALCLVGGPAQLLRPWLAPLLEEKLGLHVFVPEHGACANALGAALTLPTAHVQLFADTLQGIWRIPTLDKQGEIGRGFTLDTAVSLAQEALQQSTAAYGRKPASMDVVEAESLATLDDAGRGGKDMRVLCQWRPGIVAALTQEWE